MLELTTNIPNLAFLTLDGGQTLSLTVNSVIMLSICSTSMLTPSPSDSVPSSSLILWIVFFFLWRSTGISYINKCLSIIHDISERESPQIGEKKELDTFCFTKFGFSTFQETTSYLPVPCLNIY